MKDPFDSPVFKVIRDFENTSIMRTIRKLNNIPAMKIMRHVEVCNSLHSIQKLQKEALNKSDNLA